MLKGHVQIDLHNHNSGFTERYEHDNMITDALKYIIPNYVSSGASLQNWLMPIATRALGGLMVFDGKLTEDPANIFFPSEAHLLGYAGQYTNSSNPMSGSKNFSESMETDNGYQTVWDFGTSQCNGSIQSLALTSNPKDEGCCPFYGANIENGFHEVRRLNGDRYGYMTPLHYDVETQTMYYIGTDDYSQSSSTYDSNRRITTYHYTSRIYKEYVPTNIWRVSDGYNRANYPEVVTDVSCDIESQSSSPWSYFTNGYDGYAYHIEVRENASGDGKFTYWRMHLHDLSFKIDDPVTVTVKSCALRTSRYNMVNNGKALLVGYNSRWLYEVDLKNTVNVKSIDLGEGYWLYDIRIPAWRNGMRQMVLTNNGSSPNVYNEREALLYPDGWVTKNAPYETNVTSRSYRGTRYPYRYVTDNLLMYGREYSNIERSGYLLSNYLGSICNLSSAVTKTAASSMKITYTLTDVDE